MVELPPSDKSWRFTRDTLLNTKTSPTTAIFSMQLKDGKSTSVLKVELLGKVLQVGGFCERRLMNISVNQSLEAINNMNWIYDILYLHLLNFVCRDWQTSMTDLSEKSAQFTLYLLLSIPVCKRICGMWLPYLSYTEMHGVTLPILNVGISRSMKIDPTLPNFRSHQWIYSENEHAKFRSFFSKNTGIIFSHEVRSEVHQMR